MTRATCLVLLGLVVSACDDVEPRSTSVVTSTPMPLPSDPGLDCGLCGPVGIETGPRVIDGAEPGGVVTVLTRAPLGSLALGSVPTLATRSVLSGLLVRSLTQYVYDPDTKSMRLTPDLAVDLGSHNADFSEWLFKIRRGVTGVTARDVARGMRAAFATQHLPVALERRPDAVEVLDGRDVQIRLAAPFPDLPYAGALPAMSARAADGEPLATGPYRVEGRATARSLTLVRNDAWDPDTDPGRTAYPDGYRFRRVTSVPKPSALPPATISLDDVGAAATAGHEDRIALGLDDCQSFWALDTRRIEDVTVRRAIALAYPRVTPGSESMNLMPPSVLGADPRFRAPSPPPRVTAHDLLVRAHALGFVVRWYYASDDPAAAPTEGRVAAALARAGFHPEPVATTAARLDRMQADPNAPVNVRVGEHCARWPTGEAALSSLVRSTRIAKVGLGDNLAAFDEPSVDAEIGAIHLHAIDAQPADWERLQERVQTDFQPYVPTAYGLTALPHGRGINGMNIDDTSGMPTWKDLYVAR